MSEQTENTPEEKEVFKALNCLLLEVDESIVEDIKAKIIKMADAKDASLAALRTERDAMDEEILRVKEEHISITHYIRCSKHVDIPQLNSKEFNGSECGACVEEDMKQKDENGLPMHLRFDMENTRKMLARQMDRIDKLCQETFKYKKEIKRLKTALQNIFEMHITLEGPDDKTEFNQMHKLISEMHYAAEEALTPRQEERGK